jgi:hypothetical protein
MEDLLLRKSKVGTANRPNRSDITTGLESTNNTTSMNVGGIVLQSVSLTLLICLIYAPNLTA